MSQKALVDKVSPRARRRKRQAVHKRQLIAEVARRTSLTQGQVRETLEGILDVIAEAMAADRCVTLVGFGRFGANEHRPRAVRGLDGETYHVERRRVPSFHAYPSLRERVREQAAERATTKSKGGDPCPEARASTPND